MARSSRIVAHYRYDHMYDPVVILAQAMRLQVLRKYPSVVIILSRDRDLKAI